MGSSLSWRGACLILCAGLVALPLGCQRTTMSSSAADTHTENDEFSEMDFWDALARERAVTNHDALRALLLNFGGDPGTNYADRAAAARKRGWHPGPANESARYGWIAHAVCDGAGIKGGATMRIFGNSGRYAVREINYRGYLRGMTANQVISGMQLTTLLSRVEDDLSGEPDVPREEKDY